MKSIAEEASAEHGILFKPTVWVDWTGPET